MDLTQVSRTAILTLIARVVAAEKHPAVYADPMAVVCLEGLSRAATADERKWIADRKRFYANLSAHDAIAGTQRARVFDAAASRYIAQHPGCTVVNLGCGFDTRYWRIPHDDCRYVEVDLPEVAALKREILDDRLPYEVLGYSLLDAAWLDRVGVTANERFIFLAEGVLMFLPKPGLITLFGRLAERAADSQFVFDVIPDKYLHGLWRGLIWIEMTLNWKLDAPWVSGVSNPRDIEHYAPGLAVIDVARGSAGPIVTVALNGAGQPERIAGA